MSPPGGVVEARYGHRPGRDLRVRVEVRTAELEVEDDSLALPASLGPLAGDVAARPQHGRGVHGRDGRDVVADLTAQERVEAAAHLVEVAGPRRELRDVRAQVLPRLCGTGSPGSTPSNVGYRLAIPLPSVVGMTISTETPSIPTIQTPTRLDLFTHIHKGIRRGLFDLSAQAGATDWTSAAEVAALAAAWDTLAELLHSHTEREDGYIFRLLDGTAAAGELPEEDHRDLDDLLEDLEERFACLRQRPDAVEGLAWYRDLNRYIGTTLHHLHEEETVVMPAIWAARTDEELLECRERFIAASSGSVMATTLRLMQQALDGSTKRPLGLPE